MMNDQPGRFFFSTTCRCGEGDCEKESGAGITARLERVAISPNANQPGDVVALVVEMASFPEGWTLHPDDLEPRCSDHNPLKDLKS